MIVNLSYFGGDSKITADGDCSHEIKRCLLLGRKVMTNLDSILKSKDITLPTKVHLFKAMGFPVVMYGCESKESWVPKNWCFWAVELEKILDSPLDCKEINPKYLLEGLMLKLKLQHFGHLLRRTDSFEKTLNLGKIEGRRRRGWQMRWLDGIADWTWVWVNSGSWRWTGRPGVLQSMGSQSWTWLSNWPEHELYCHNHSSE